MINFLNKYKIISSWIISFIFAFLISYNFLIIAPFFIVIIFIKKKTNLNESNIIAKTFAILMLLAYPVKVYFSGITQFSLISTGDTVFKFDAIANYFIWTIIIDIAAFAFLLLCIKDDIKQQKKS